MLPRGRLGCICGTPCRATRQTGVISGVGRCAQTAAGVGPAGRENTNSWARGSVAQCKARAQLTVRAVPRPGSALVHCGTTCTLPCAGAWAPRHGNCLRVQPYRGLEPACIAPPVRVVRLLGPGMRSWEPPGTPAARRPALHPPCCRRCPPAVWRLTTGLPVHQTRRSNKGEEVGEGVSEKQYKATCRALVERKCGEGWQRVGTPSMEVAYEGIEQLDKKGVASVGFSRARSRGRGAERVPHPRRRFWRAPGLPGSLPRGWPWEPWGLRPAARGGAPVSSRRCVGPAQPQPSQANTPDSSAPAHLAAPRGAAARPPRPPPPARRSARCRPQW